MKGLWWNNVVVSVELPIQVTPPGEVSQAGETDDVQSPGLGTVCHVAEPDVLRGDSACIRVGVVPLGCIQYRPFRRLLVSTVRHTTWWLWDYESSFIDYKCFLREFVIRTQIELGEYKVRINEKYIKQCAWLSFRHWKQFSGKICDYSRANENKVFVDNESPHCVMWHTRG